MKALAISLMLLLAVACKHEELATSPARTAEVQQSPVPANGRPESSDNQHEITWVRGRVSDEQGRPIANATVYALAIDHGGLRNYETTKQASTDQRGYYELKGLGSYEHFLLTLVATAPGRAPAWA